MKKISLFILFLLTGCAGVPSDSPEVIRQAQHDRRSAERIAIDLTIERDLYASVHDDSQLTRLTHVQFNAYNSAVLVTGEVPDLELKHKLIEMTRVTKPVKLVHDNITIAQPIDESVLISDKQMSDDIKAALTQIRSFQGFDSGMVKVITENAVVYLMGQVRREEGTVVINVVRHRPHVQQIVTVFEYLD